MQTFRGDYLPSMDIKTTNTASLDPKAVLKLQDLLLKLDSAAFKAIITHKISNQLFSINTKVGTLKISTDLPIQAGDELTLKINPSKTTSVANLDILKINRPLASHSAPIINTAKSADIAPTLLLNNQTALKNMPKTQQHFIAKVISQDKSSIQLQSIKGESFSINKSNFKNTAINIQKGEYLAIKWMPQKNVEIQSINKEQLLHHVQRQLLPKQQSSLQTHQRLNQAAFKLFESINNEAKHIVQQTKLKLNIQNIRLDTLLPNDQNNKSIKLSDVPAKQSQLSSSLPTNAHSLETLIKTLKDNPSLTKNRNVSINPGTLITIKHIKQELTNLLTSNRISLKHLGSDNIQKLLNSLNTLSQSNNSSVTNSQSFSQKLSLINQSIEQLLNDIDTQTNKTKNTSAKDEVFLEALKASLKEARNSFESTLHKVLFQNTSSKLHQEINNTLLINTQIPFEIEKQTKDINLKIKQQKKENEEQDDTWEIHLSLEMGLLGLISTKIMLKDQYEVSIKFWAELGNTKQLIEDKKNTFQQQMNHAGFTLKDINIYLGKIKEENLPKHLTNKQFIDINV